MDSEELEQLIPQLNVNVPQVSQEENNLIPDELIMGLYSEILNNIRKDREDIGELLNNFVDMVINGGDSTTSSKEALVNLVKIQTETNDKMSKVADLITRVKLKERDTFPKYLTANQENKITINNSGSKRELIKAINKIQQVKNQEKAG